MGVQNSVVDCLTRIRNAVARGHKKVYVPKSKTVEGVLRVLQDEGYIDSFVEGVVSTTGSFQASHALETGSDRSKQTNNHDNSGGPQAEVSSVKGGTNRGKMSLHKPVFEVTLRYFRNQKPVINEIKLVSKGSRRIYSGIDRVPMIKRGLGIVIMSTNKGIMSDRKARELRVGGELIAVVN